MDFNGHKPIYLQIYDHVCEDAKEKILSEQKKEFLENEVPEFLKKMEL